MKTLFVFAVSLGLLTGHAFGQGAQADQIKRRAKEVVNQNNVRQGAAQPTPAPSTPSPAAAKPATTYPTLTPAQASAKIQAALAGFKPGTPVTSTQKQQFIKDLAMACRGAKPSLPTVTAFVDALTAAIGDKSLEASQQSRLAQNIDGALNSATSSSSQFDTIIADVQAILQVGGAKRDSAIAAANKLKAVGLEVRKASGR